jgi:hypothetical protein
MKEFFRAFKEELIADAKAARAGLAIGCVLLATAACAAGIGLAGAAIAGAGVATGATALASLWVGFSSAAIAVKLARPLRKAPEQQPLPYNYAEAHKVFSVTPIGPAFRAVAPAAKKAQSWSYAPKKRFTP